MTKIRKVCLFLFLSCGLSMSLYAQMSDEQVINYVKESKAAGKGEQEIGRELLSRGVNKAQVERIKARYEESQGDNTEVANPSGGNERRERRSVENSFTETTAGSMDMVGEVVGDPTEQSDRRASRLVFGRDVFNGRALTFEPNENISRNDFHENVHSGIQRTNTHRRMLRSKDEHSCCATNAHTPNPL